MWDHQTSMKEMVYTLVSSHGGTFESDLATGSAHHLKEQVASIILLKVYILINYLRLCIDHVVED